MRRIWLMLVCSLLVWSLAETWAHASGAEEYFREGYAASMAREWEDAIKWYTKAVEQSPKLAEAYFQRAIVFEMTDRPDRAIADYRKTLELKPDYYLAMEYLAKVYEKQGDYAKALDLYTKALGLVKDPKWRSIVRWWIERAKKQIAENRGPTSRTTVNKRNSR